MTSRLSFAIGILFGCVTPASGLHASAGALTIRMPQRFTPLPIAMMAKKKSKPRKPDKKASSSGAGFSASPPPAAAASPAPTSLSETMGAPTSPPPTTASGAPLDSRLDDVLAQAGITQTDESLLDANRGPESPLSSIPLKGQELLEKFFGGGAIVFGSAFLLAGITVAFEAVCKVAKVDLPVAVDEAIVQYIFPSLTPSILILFFFSISLGILKQVSFTPCTCQRLPCIPDASSQLVYSRGLLPLFLAACNARPVAARWCGSCSSAARLAAFYTRRRMRTKARVTRSVDVLRNRALLFVRFEHEDRRHLRRQARRRVARVRTERQAHSTADVAEVMATDASWCTLSRFEVRICVGVRLCRAEGYVCCT